MKPLAASIAAALFIAGCGQTTPAVDTGAIQAVVIEVQAAAVKLCKFLPTNDSVVKIITASAVGDTAYNIAKLICDAVTASAPAPAPGASLFGATKQCPMVNGVCVEGQFVTEGPTDKPPPQ